MKQAIRTPAQNRDFWLNLADGYDKEAARARLPGNKQVWQKRAADAREKAASYEA